MTAAEKARQKLEQARALVQSNKKSFPKYVADKVKALGDNPTDKDIAKAQKEIDLKAKMAKVMPTPAAPSMAPAKKEKKEKAPPPPDLREIDIDEDDRRQVARLVNQAAEYKRMEKEGKKGYEPLSARIKLLIQDNTAAHKFMCDGHRAVMTKTTKSSISKDLLLAAGIAPEIIKACTVETESWMLTVTPAGVPDDTE